MRPSASQSYSVAASNAAKGQINQWLVGNLAVAKG
jgi:hypothetical protein